MKLAAGPIPLYHQLEQDIAARIADGEFPQGHLLPTEEQIGSSYGVSRITVRKALDTLMTQGLIIRRRGVGSFVAERQGVHSVQLSGSLNDFLNSAYHLTPKVISLELCPAPPDVATDFGLSSWEQALRLELISFGEDGPLAHARIYFRPEVHDVLSVEDITYNEPVIRTLEGKLGVRIARATQFIEATSAERDTAGYLDLPVGTPILKTCRRYFTASGETVEVAQLLYHPQRYRYKVDLRATPFAV